MQGTVDGGRERSLEAMADCAAMMLSGHVDADMGGGGDGGGGGGGGGDGGTGAGADAGTAAAGANAWSSWTAEARLRRFMHAGNWPL